MKLICDQIQQTILLNYSQWPFGHCLQIKFFMKDIKQAQNKNSTFSQLKTHFEEITLWKQTRQSEKTTNY